ncbi:MAG TPA: type I DNA topoisomerase [Chloroflexus aurantiacus]|jgi:DNA topoisomerase-1|uniref:DNA topoisomerase 1 n=1 Tax=Chloroflexus aurantiacus (strain ATCC 29366 / DSM 635 / J-10-fl) TaxID=324602 RepID=A9WDH5_CHLAA|nr:MULTISPECIES: type I DNA topoisomerase [Chloroflexus]ABY37094.1 DNA topoisomerase I [Chloroflexus aurantiacus J-10-fl]RMG50687.1 MAG: type I DNA topoisomerase [Chloroflexota bacterium]HBW66940.1 type I DNA topoisomerase [Chloroflexus aurantiacus]
MGEKVVIVESPAKARTIQKYLGKGYKVASSMGHVRDLPKSGLAIDIEHDFAPSYEIVKPKVVSELSQALRNAEAVYLATDPDREGEAIAWHITQAVKLPKKTPVYRVVFQEITRNAVQQALQQPRQINQNLVEAQQARRVLDRLVGYQLSPLLWDKVKRGLSAGRVQSVAVRLIVEREREIEQFQPQEYWTIEADLLKDAGVAPRDLFRAVLIERDGKKLEKFSIENREQAEAIVADLQGAAYTVVRVTRRDKRRSPAPPFTTSTLQQEAARKLGFSAKKTMTLAQRLYEGVDIGGEDGMVGLITYMRTDSVQVAAEAQTEARDVIGKRFGKEYLPDQPPVYKTKAKGAQEAHEAIRPTSSARLPEQLSGKLENDLWRLYDLIWKRFIASQMAPAVFDSTTVDIAATPVVAGAPAYLFRATGSVLKFPGFLAVYNVSLDEGEEDEDSERRLPPLAEGEALQLVELLPIQHFTEPPPRYTEASLVKELERLGIGRPSTYASILSTIQEREYVEMVDKKLIPTTLGRVVTDLLVEHFGNIVDYDFTSALEQQLDDIAEGSKKWVPVLREFYGPFRSTLEQAQRQMRNVKREEIVTDLDCPKCGQGKLVIRFGRNGEFLACSRYNREGDGESCDFTSDFHRDEQGQIVIDKASAPETSDVLCNVCGRPMVIKKSRFGPFLGCSGYPECNNTRRIGRDGKPVPLPEPTGVQCPKCGEGELLRRRGKFGRPFYGCSRYPKCDYITNTLDEAQAGEAPAEPAKNEPALPSPSRSSKRTRKSA